MKRLLLALGLCLWASSALAQNPTCPTRPVGDNSNACASTAFVQSAVVAAGVASIQGMTGALTCGANMTCSAGVISSTGGGTSTLTHSHIFVGDGSNVATDFGTLALFADTGGLTLAPSSGNALTVTTTAGTGQGIVVTNAGSSATPGANFTYNNIVVSNDAVVGDALTGFATFGAQSTLQVFTNTAKGSKYGFRGLVNQSASSIATGGDAIGVGGWAISNTPNGGTNTGAGAAGTLFGFESVAHAFSGATNYFVVSGVEFDTIVDTGATTKHRWGISVSGNGAVRGAVSDAAIEIGSPISTGSFVNAILLSSANSQPPLPTTGCVICVDLDGRAAYSITTGIDLSALTSITGNFINIPTFTLTGAGTITKSGYGTGIIHSSVAGALTSSAIVSADLNITTTTCTNQFLTAISATGTGTCTTATLASAQFANQGTTTTVLHGNAAGNPSWSGVSLTADVVGVLAGASGGTGLSTAAIGDIIYASATTPTWARLADVATGSVLVSGGANIAPAWSAAPSLGTSVTAPFFNATTSSAGYKIGGLTILNFNNAGGGIIYTQINDSDGVAKFFYGNAGDNKAYLRPGEILFQNAAGSSTYVDMQPAGTTFSNGVNSVTVTPVFVQTPVLTVATLAVCAGGTEGARSYVSDNNTAAAYRGAVTSGGAPITRGAVLCSNGAWIQD